MKLIECYVENFGKLSGFKYSFETGMNSFKRDNGYGKTTLSVFIKAMLYGLDDTKRQKLETNDRKHYLPWQGGIAGGYLVFENKNKTYRVERTFAAKASDDTFKLYDAKSGKESDDYSSELGEELFGIDADGFERTVFLSEQNLSGKNENKTVSAKLSDLVGADGDIGVMDDALLILEKQRKAYHRRGGAGEIGEIKKQISNLTLEANELLRVKLSYEEDKKKLSEIELELEKLKAKKAELDRAAKKAEEERSKRAYIKHYLDMKRTLLEEENAKKEVEAFFINGIPDDSELNEAKAKDAELKHLTMLNETQNETREYTELDAFFSCGASETDFENLSRLSDIIDARERQRSMLYAEIDTANEELKKYNQNYLPESEYSRLISELSTKSGKTSHNDAIIMTVIGAAITLLGIALGIFIKTILFIVSALGASFLAISVAINRKNDNNRLHSLHQEVKSALNDSDINNLEMLNALYSKKAEAQRYFELSKKQETLMQNLSEANEEISTASREACEFISHFPVKSTDSILDATAEIIKKRDLYLALKRTETSVENARIEREAKKRELSRQIQSFTKNFKTTSAYPIEEIERKLLEYDSLSKSVLRIQSSMESFAKEHGIVYDTIDDREICDFEVQENEQDVLLKISEFERRRTLLERQCREAELEIERIEDIKNNIAELTEKEKKYQKDLNIILLTQKYLGEAKDLLTSKYLSKTKQAFNDYIGMLNRELGEGFVMDTSFSISKSEHGALRPTEAYSKGMRDLYFLSARLALVDSLYENEEPFIILDDPFAHFDDKHLKAATALLAQLAKKRQIIYLTCTSSRDI